MFSYMYCMVRSEQKNSFPYHVESPKDPVLTLLSDMTSNTSQLQTKSEHRRRLRTWSTTIQVYKETSLQSEQCFSLFSASMIEKVMSSAISPADTVLQNIYVVSPLGFFSPSASTKKQKIGTSGLQTGQQMLGALKFLEKNVCRLWRMGRRYEYTIF